jgi:hypothetical protein
VKITTEISVSIDGRLLDPTGWTKAASSLVQLRQPEREDLLIGWLKNVNASLSEHKRTTRPNRGREEVSAKLGMRLQE